MIESLQNKRIKDLKKLYRKKYREREKAFLIEGKKMVDEAIQLDRAIEVFCTESMLETYAEHNPVLISEEVMNDISTFVTPPGVLAKVSYEESKETWTKLLLVENLRDPGNMGTILRSCEAFGFALGLLGDCVDPYNEKAIQSSMGSILRLPIYSITYTQLQAWKNQGHQIIGSRLEDSVPPEKIRFSSRGILLIGNESHGLSRKAESLCTGFVKIPMTGDVESLNASIAASILMYQFMKDS